MWEDPACCGWCHSQVGDLRCYKKTDWAIHEEQASKQHSSVAYAAAPHSKFLLVFLSDGLLPDVYITVIEALSQAPCSSCLCQEPENCCSPSHSEHSFSPPLINSTSTYTLDAVVPFLLNPHNVIIHPACSAVLSSSKIVLWKHQSQRFQNTFRSMFSVKKYAMMPWVIPIIPDSVLAWPPSKRFGLQTHLCIIWTYVLCDPWGFI